MSADPERQARRILEVDPDAPMEDILRAYLMLRRIYGRDQAMFTAPGMDEFSPEARQDALAQIEAAYSLLRALLPETGQAVQARPAVLEIRSLPPAPRPKPPAEPAAELTALRRAREAAGFSLDQVAAETNVRREYLSALEEERFEQLRLATVNVRGYLTAFVNTIGLPVDEVVPPYMQRFLQWQARRP